MSSPSKIKAIDMRLIEDLFGMGGGYVLDFSNKTFAEFFEDELGINIDDARFDAEGSSKAKRLRFFLRTADSELRIRTLGALWNYRQDASRRGRLADSIPNAEEEFHLLIGRLGGALSPEVRPDHGARVASQAYRVTCDELKNELIALSQLQPHPRGFAYERFLRKLFDADGLAARASFRLVGEQIDGSFELSAETYLLEAKWINLPVGAAELRSFNAKVEEKAAWSRGLFVSDSGFTPEGISAFGRGKRVVCMDGLDLYDMLEKHLPVSEVLARKVRRAAETGNPFVRVRDLYN
jgi:hypothetical protein